MARTALSPPAAGSAPGPGRAETGGGGCPGPALPPPAPPPGPAPPRPGPAPRPGGRCPPGPGCPKWRCREAAPGPARPGPGRPWGGGAQGSPSPAQQPRGTCRAAPDRPPASGENRASAGCCCRRFSLSLFRLSWHTGNYGRPEGCAQRDPLEVCSEGFSVCSCQRVKPSPNQCPDKRDLKIWQCWLSRLIPQEWKK